MEAPAASVVDFGDVEQTPVWNRCTKKANKKSCTESSLNDWMNRNIDTKVVKVPGRYALIVNFLIGIDGKVKNIVVHGGSDELATEVIKQLKKLPRFEPGTSGGKPVAVNFTLPIELVRF